jgi:hypothetical membrane protein
VNEKENAMTDASTARPSTVAPRTETTRRTRALLACGVAAGPLYIVVAVVQILTRDGYDVTRHALSLLANGALGWVQISNFVVAGLLTLAGAVGLRQALQDGRGRTWGPRLLGVYGGSLIAAAFLVADPALGFPPGTPEGPPADVTWHGVGHFIAGAVGFFALIAACFVFARRFAALGQRAWATFSMVTGVVFFAAFLGIAAGNVIPGINVAFGIAVVLAWTWISALCARLLRSMATR